MRVGIIGNYGNDNNGDEAILIGIIHQLTEHLSIRMDDIVVFSNRPHNTLSRYGIASVPLYYKESNLLKTVLKTIVSSYKTMKTLDLLIIGGGGLLMDLYRRGAPLYSSLGFIGRLAGCKVAIYGVGAGPINTSMGKFFLKRLANKADTISVRDDASKVLLEQIGVNNEIKVIGDPAFAVPKHTSRKRSSTIKKIGITAVPYFSAKYWPTSNEEKYQRYVHGMAANINQLILKKDVEVTFYSTKYPQDVVVTEEIYKLIEEKDKVRVINENLFPQEIVRLGADFDLVIGTRLHSLILALVTNTPVIGIGYHHKVLDFMRAIEQEEFGLEIDELVQSENKMLNLVNKYESDWVAYQSFYEDKSKQFKLSTDDGVKQLQEVLQRAKRD